MLLSRSCFDLIALQLDSVSLSRSLWVSARIASCSFESLAATHIQLYQQNKFEDCAFRPNEAVIIILQLRWVCPSSAGVGRR